MMEIHTIRLTKMQQAGVETWLENVDEGGAIFGQVFGDGIRLVTVKPEKAFEIKKIIVGEHADLKGRQSAFEPDATTDNTRICR